MTITSTSPREIKNGNGTATVFSFTFVVNQASDLVVTLVDANDNETVLTEGTGTTNYSVSVSSYPGTGSVTYPATLGTELAGNEQLIIQRVVDIDQETDLVNQGAWKPEQVENTFDYSRMIDLQQQDELDRAIKSPASTPLGTNYTLPAPESLALFRWNEAATDLEAVQTADLVTTANFSNFKTDTFADGVDYTAGTTTQITLDSAPGTIANTQVYFDGVYQEKADYALAGTVITFDTAIPVSVSTVEVVYGKAADVLAGSTRETQLGDGSKTVFTLSNGYEPGNGTLHVYINGVRQEVSYGYTETDANTVTFDSAPANNDLVLFIVNAFVSQTTADASNVSYTPSGTGAVATNVQAKLSESVSVKDFGATGDGVTDDTAAFTALESAHGGSYVDLYEGVYAVTAIPTGCKYYNGDFVVGSTRTSLRRNRLDHPFDGNQWVAYGNGKSHYWLFGMTYEETNDQLIAFVKPAWRHSESYSTPLNVIFSQDKGQTWEGEKTIHSVDGWDIAHVAAAEMASGRTGALVSVRDNGAPNQYRLDFVYSDDNGDTWTVSASEIAHPNGSHLYGPMLPYPTSAGGDDTNGFICYGYYGSRTDAIYTTDNGATWTATTINSDTLQELSVVRVGTEDKWLGFYRENGANLKISTSSNMTTWTTPVDTGIDLQNNPVYAVYEGGQVYVYLAIRDIDPTIAAQNDVICIEDNALAVYAASDFTNAAYRQVITGTERCLGYFNHVKIGQDYVWGYTAGEVDVSTNNASDSYIVMGSTRRSPLVGLGLTKQLSSNDNLVRNPTFEFWSRGTSFAGFTSNTKTADGWEVRPSGATITAQRTELSVEDSRLLPFSGRYSLDISSTADDFITVSQEYKGESELYRWAENNVTMQVWGLGDVPDGLSGQVLFDYGSGGSTDVSTNVNFKVTEGAGLLWKGTVTIPTATLEGKTIGTDPLVRIAIQASGSGAWTVQLCGVKVEFGAYATAFKPIDIEVERQRSAQYVQKIEFGSFDQITNGFAPNTTTFWGVLPFSPMREIPTATLNVGAVGDVELYPAAAFGTAVTFNEVTKDRLSFRVTTTGLTANNPYIARSKSGASVEILLDTE